MSKIHGEGFALDLDDRDGYLRAFVAGGSDSLAISLAYWTALGQECARRKAANLLVVEDLDPFDAGPEALELVCDTMVLVGLDRVRVAFVDVQEIGDVNESGMMVGFDKGLTLMLFSTESLADRWLRFGSKNSATTSESR